MARFGVFSGFDRKRLEVLHRRSGVRVRYRNMLRLNVGAADARWIPFVWDEVLFDLKGRFAVENRATVGVGYVLGRDLRLDAGVMLRSRAVAAGHDHTLVVVMHLFMGAAATAVDPP